MTKNWNGRISNWVRFTCGTSNIAAKPVFIMKRHKKKHKIMITSFVKNGRTLFVSKKIIKNSEIIINVISKYIEKSDTDVILSIS